MLRARIEQVLKQTPYLWRYADRFGVVFPGSATYWERRYRNGGTSGAGSRGRLARFKADFLNAFVTQHELRSVIEFGCGDGSQLELAHYERYIGLDVSPSAVATCIKKFGQDRTKAFFLYDHRLFLDNVGLYRADLALSLDVIYHLVEDDVFGAYIQHLFQSAEKYVVIYSSNRDEKSQDHVRHRRFTDHIATAIPDWALIATQKQVYPDSVLGSCDGSFADFFVYTPR